MSVRQWILVAAVCGVGLGVAGCVAGADPAKIDRPAPEVAAGPWINSAPLSTSDLRGRVVLVEFWTYG
jgi:hypothetical protein